MSERLQPEKIKEELGADEIVKLPEIPKGPLGILGSYRKIQEIRKKNDKT